MKGARRLGILLLLAFVCCARGIASATAGVPVLMYHMVDAHTPRDPVGRALTIEPRVFAAQLQFLRDHGIRTITMNQLADALAHGVHPRKTVVLTFDDGYADGATIVTPLLRKYGDVASFYVSEGFLGDGRHLSWAQLRMMRADGMEIGCHGTYHLDLSTLSRAGQEREIDRCIDTVARYLARPTTYAYPAGKWNATTIRLLRAAKIKAALTERPGDVTSLADWYEEPRERVARGAGLADFAALVSR